MIRRTLLSLVAVSALSLVLGLWASAGIALGLNPESLQTLDWLAPLLSLFVVSVWLGRGKTWRAGFIVAFPNIGFWLLMHWFCATRFHLEFWRDGVSQLGWSHGLWWSLAVLVSLAGAFVGSTSKARITVVPLTLLVVSLAQLVTPRESDTRFEGDGTSVRVLQFDLKTVDFGSYDADSDDSHALDNRNTTWLLQAMPRVWSKIAARNGTEPLCVINGGFFGAEEPLIATHEAPLRQNGRSLYDVKTLQDDWPNQNATLVWKREKSQTQPRILRVAAFSELAQFDGALGGVRVLIQNGQSENLKPGMGGTTLKCSRTSVAWNTQTGQFWILSVRDPDGEASSMRDNKREKQTKTQIQVGGWNVGQIQQFWQTKGATDAVLFDGGESGQIAYRNENGKWRWIHSSYHLSRTPAFWNKRPLRAVLPMLPPTLANGGVLNWFFVRKQEQLVVGS